jgi:hypothetical protein
MLVRPEPAGPRMTTILKSRRSSAVSHAERIAVYNRSRSGPTKTSTAKGDRAATVGSAQPMSDVAGIPRLRMLRIGRLQPEPRSGVIAPDGSLLDVAGIL